MKAIVYLSNAGHTERYAKLLSEALDLPCYSLKDAKKAIPLKSEIIYMGWLLGGMIQGYGKAKARYVIKALCPVGMSENEGQVEVIRDKNDLSSDFPLFLLPGGFELEKVHGIYRAMMGFASKMMKKQMENPNNEPMPDAQPIMEMMVEGKDLVDASHLDRIIQWYRG